jgi:hypothetical protein
MIMRRRYTYNRDKRVRDINNNNNNNNNNMYCNNYKINVALGRVVRNVTCKKKPSSITRN